MSTREKLIQARISMLALADELQSISRACQVAGISRSHFYEIKDAFEKYGRDGLAPQPRRRPRVPNETPPEREGQILTMTREYPTYSYVKIADQLKLIGVPATANQVRGVWLRRGLVKRYDRLLWLEREAAATGGPLTERVAKLLARYQRQQLTDPEQHIEAPAPGYLGCQDTYFVGTLKGVGRIYAQAFVDADCSWAQAKLYLSKIPMTAVDLLHDRVLPVYEAAGVALERILTDNGREFCGRVLQHPYELYLAVQQIEHPNTKVHSPQTNGFCERFHRTLKEEFVSVAYRKKLYASVQELQEDLDGFVRFYNEERSHQGYRTQGRTPWQAFQDGVLAMNQDQAA
jgi:transposase InsO family protein